MAKQEYTLTQTDRVTIARSKRLREAGASVSISGTAGSAGGSGVDEKGIEDIAVTGSGNAVTDAALSSDKSLLTLRKGKTFLNQEDANGLFIRKDQDDGTDYSLYVNTDLDVKGTTTLQELNVNGNTTLQQVVEMFGQVISHDDLRISTNFVSGLLGEGGHFSQGYGEMRGLTLWEWLEVPELRYNRVSVNTGITWQTFGGGIIESVVVGENNTGTITLKLEKGEIGAIAVNDLCMGIYHNEGGENDDYDEDTHDGNFHFAGFKTVYFRVTEITNTSDNSEFKYILRSDDTQTVVGNWTEHNHPTAAMHFAAYANTNDDTRQNCHYSTTKYLVSLHNMTSWEYGAANIYYIRGELKGFTVGGTQLQGTGIYIGNGYFSGMLQQIENAEYVMDLGLDVGETILLPSETRTIAPTITRAFTDYTGNVATWSVVRESEDTSGDAEWNARHADFAGVLETSFDDLLGDNLTNAMLTFAAVLDDSCGNVRVTCSAVFRFVQGEQGEDAVYPVVSADNFVFAEGETSKSFTISVYKGREQVALSTGNVTFQSLVSPYSVSLSESGGTITATISRGSATSYSSVSYTIQAEDMTFDRSIALEYVFNGEQGEQGEQGEPGADAVYYELVLSNDTLHYNAAAASYAPESITIQVRKVEGEERNFVTFSGTSSAVKADGSGADNYTYRYVSTYTFTPTNVYSEVYLRVSDVEDGEHTISLEKVIYPTSSFMPRLQVWEQVEDGFTFQAGVVGDMFIDCVIYPGTKGGYFVCIKGHDKSSGNAPTEGLENEWWKPMNKFDNVATDLLLADTAKIDNLYVDDIYMEGDTTAVWINPNNNGVKINDVKRVEDEGRESVNWANPTTWLHGTAIPDPSQVYSGSGEGSSSTSITSASIRAGNTGLTVSTWTNLSSIRPSVSVTTGTTVTFTTTEATFTFTQGDPLETSIIYSEMHVQLRLATSTDALRSENGYTLLDSFSFIQAGNEGDTYTYRMGQKSVTIVAEGNTSSSTTTYYIGLVYTCSLRPRSMLSMSNSSISLSYQAIQDNYISQYGANGLFIGQKSDTYFRAQVGEEGASAYDMLADGYGLSISPSGSLQQVAGNVMPFGGCLAMVYINADGTTAEFDGWTWDNSLLAVQYNQTGRYRIYLPNAWRNYFGSWDSDTGTTAKKIILSAQFQSASSQYFVSAGMGNQSGYWGYVDIYMRSSSGAVDAPVRVRIDYAPFTQTASAGLSSSAITSMSYTSTFLNVLDTLETNEIQ